jgi:hypothetical protein
MYLVAYYHNNKMKKIVMFETCNEAIEFAKSSFLEKNDKSEMCNELLGDNIDVKYKIAQFSNKKGGSSYIVVSVPENFKSDSDSEKSDSEEKTESYEYDESNLSDLDDNIDISDEMDIDLLDETYFYGALDKYDRYNNRYYVDECYECLDF